ncbi:MAG TPA: hypothetical protein VN634_22385, partial [Candidatus Limnocylindrales bacterium]|nr:hypothetical protein [Candidatus Limnocylindrales bacterium]
MKRGVAALRCDPSCFSGPSFSAGQRSGVRRLQASGKSHPMSTRPATISADSSIFLSPLEPPQARRAAYVWKRRNCVKEFRDSRDTFGSIFLLLNVPTPLLTIPYETRDGNEPATVPSR